MDLAVGLTEALGLSDPTGSNFSSQCANYTCLSELGPAEPLYSTSGNILATSAAVAWWMFFVMIMMPWFPAATAALVTWLTTSIPNLLFDGKGTCPRKLPSSVWTIHGKKYDLSSWVSEHPGGPWAINLGRNRDCTGLFESYHIFADREKLFKILKPFEILAEDKVPALPVSTPEAAVQPARKSLGENLTGLEFCDAFHEDIKEMLREHFKGKSHHMKPWAACLFIGFFVAQMLIGYMFMMGSNAALVLLPIISWLLSSNVAHDGSHFAVSSRPWVNRLASCAAMPFIFPPTCWNLQHVVQHHVYTNDEDDVDLYHFLPVVRATKQTSWASQFFWQWLSLFIVIPTTVGHLMFIVPMDLLSGQVDLITGKKRYEQCQNIADFVARSRGTIWCEFAFCLSWLFLNLYVQGAYTGMMRMFMLYGMESYFFIIITQGAHLHGACFHDKGEEKSWAKRQVATALNFAPGSFLWQTLTGGLNMQSLHHVAPVVGSSHFNDLYPKYKKVCEKHGVEVKEVYGVAEFFRGFVRWIQELSKKDP